MAERGYYLGPYAGFGTVEPVRCVHANIEDASTDAVTYTLRLSHETTGEAAAGIGVGVEFVTDAVVATVEAVNLTPGGDVAGEIVFKTNNELVDGIAERVRILYDGTVRLQTCVDADADVDKFLVLDATGNIKHRTGAEVLSDIGGIPSNVPVRFVYDGEFLQIQAYIVDEWKTFFEGSA